MSIASVKRVVIIILILFAVSSVVPYLLPINPEHPITVIEKPFSESQFAIVDDVKIHYRHWHAVSPTRGCSVLLLHGYLGSTVQWQEITSRLALRGRYVVAVDLPGNGYSARALWPDEISALWHFLDQRGQPETPWCLVGQGHNSAQIIAAMALAQPTRVAGVAYVNGMPLTSQRPSLWQKMRAYIPAVKRWRMVQLSKWLRNRDRIQHWLEQSFDQAPDDAVVTDYYTPLQIKDTSLAMIDYSEKKRQNNYSAEQLSKIPSLILWGEDNPNMSKIIAMRLAALLPEAKFVAVRKAARLPAETHPSQTLRELNRWLDGLLNAPLSSARK